jgi:outer membrane protein
MARINGYMTRGLLILALLLTQPLITSAEETLPGGGSATLPVPPPAPSFQEAFPSAGITQPGTFEPFQARSAARIGYLDIARIGRDSLIGKSAQARFKEKTDKLQSQITSKQKQLEKQKKELEAKLPTLIPDQRAAKAKEFEKKVEEYRKFVQKAEKELQPLQEELTKSVFVEIEKAAAAYGASAGLTAIVVKKELLYQGNGVTTEDITDAILKLVDEKGAKP